MLALLQEAERLLPKWLDDERGWTGLYADTAKPFLKRLWRQWGENRVYLHRFEGCGPGEAFAHPHPWPFAVRVLAGRYGMDISVLVRGLEPADVIATTILEPGSCYAMTDPRGCHAVRPLTDVSVSLMVAGPPIFPQNRVKTQKPVRELTPVERHGLFAVVRDWYATR